MKEEKCSKKVMTSTIVGTVGGFGLGVLLAPKKGSELRRSLRTKMYRIVDKIKALESIDVDKELEHKIKIVEHEIKNLNKEKNFENAKKKSMTIKDMMDDIIDMAAGTKDKDIKKMAKDVKNKTNEAIEEILKRIEEN